MRLPGPLSTPPASNPMHEARARLAVLVVRLLCGFTALVATRDLFFAEDPRLAAVPAIVSVVLVGPAIRGWAGRGVRAGVVLLLHLGVAASIVMVGPEVAGASIIAPAFLTFLLIALDEKPELMASIGVSLAMSTVVLFAPYWPVEPLLDVSNDPWRAGIVATVTSGIVLAGSAWWATGWAEAGRRTLQLRDDAEAANRAKDKFLANMSHELRTPAAAIRGFADLLDDDSLSAAQGREYVAVIGRNARHLLGLLDDLLDLSKVGAGTLAIEIETVDVQALLNGVIEDVRTTRQDTDPPELLMRAQTSFPPTIRTDPRRARQILLNLVGNALKFADGSVQITLAAEETRLEITVDDDGPGLGSGDPEALFAPFVQGDHGLAMKTGTGLGLALCREFALALGGTVQAQSRARGARFTLVLPVEPDNGNRVQLADPGSAVAVAEPPEVLRDRLSGLKVMVAEDNLDLAVLLRLELERRGATTVLVHDGAAAIATLETESPAPDVILMDVDMPRLDGLTATRRLRDTGLTTTIFALTAFAMKGDRERCLEAGCDDHFSKPVDMAVLVDRLASFVSSEPAPQPQVDFHAAFAALTDEYRAGLPVLADELVALVDQGDLEALARAAHKIAGSAGSFGFHEIGEVARSLEQGVILNSEHRVLVGHARQIHHLVASL